MKASSTAVRRDRGEPSRNGRSRRRGDRARSSSIRVRTRSSPSPDGRLGFRSAGAGLARDVPAPATCSPGVIAAMRARGMPPFEAACAGVWLQGMAAEIAGPQMIADDLAEPSRRHRLVHELIVRIAARGDGVTASGPPRAVRRAGRCAARRRCARSGAASPGAAVPPFPGMRRLPAPACRRRGVSRLSRLAGRDGAGAARSRDRNSRAAPVAAAQPPPRDAAGAEDRQGRRARIQRREVAPDRRHARVPYPEARAVRAGRSRCGELLADLLQPKRIGGSAADARRPGRGRAAQGRRRRRARRDRAADVIRIGARPGAAERRPGAWAGDASTSRSPRRSPVRDAGCISGRRISPGDRGRRGGAGRCVREAVGERGRSPTCSPASAPSRLPRGPAMRPKPRAMRRRRSSGRRRHARSSIATSIAGRSIPAS